MAYPYVSWGANVQVVNIVIYAKKIAEPGQIKEFSYVR